MAHCVNTLPLRCRIDLANTFAKHLRRVHEALLEAQAHEHVTFGSLVPKLPRPSDLSRPPLVAVTCNIDRRGAEFDFGDVTLDAEMPRDSPFSIIETNIIAFHPHAAAVKPALVAKPLPGQLSSEEWGG